MNGLFYKTREDIFLFLKETAETFFQLTLSLLFLFLLARIFEYFFISHLHNLPENSTQIAFAGVWYDIVFVVKIVVYMVIPFTLISYFKPKIAKGLFIFISLLLLLGNFLLIVYYSKSLVPLGSDLFGYSFQEILHTINAPGEINLLTIFSIVVIIFLFVTVFHFSKKIPLSNVVLYLLTTLLFISFFFAENVIPRSENYKTDLEFYTVVNKLQFFSEKVIPYLFNEDWEVIAGDYFIDSSKDQEQSFYYVDKDFPFMRIDSSQNVLGKFFQTLDELPNFVFIITESLGKSYSGVDAADGSFTPFLDSLARQSLYWKNFLSTSGRTFAVFSSLLGSLPFAKNGFLDLKNKMPAHATLISFLKQLGYTADFFHGGDVHFDNMDVFFKRQHVDFILGDKNFGGGYKKMPSNAEGFSWGYGDKELFKRSLEIIDQQKKSPRIDVYMTLSMHDPFLVEGQAFYQNKVREQLKTMPFTVEQKEKYEKYIDKYATVMYTDDAFKYFFDEYKKRNDFKNTIFIITGDHRMPEIPIKNKLDRFHVPFLIYSPMLKRQKMFSSVSTHFDVLPSLMALLRSQYNVETPKYVTWLGSGLDTVQNFRNIHSAPLMRNKNELLDYLDGEYFLADQEVFQVFDNMSISKAKDIVVQRRLLNYFNEFRVKNKIMLQTNSLLPDSILSFSASIRKEASGKK